MLAVATAAAGAVPARAGWSAPFTLPGCAVTAPPGVAFPSSAPSAPTGPGAIAWLAPSGACTAAAGAAGPLALQVAWLGRADTPTRIVRSTAAAAAAPVLAAAGTGLGRVAEVTLAGDGAVHVTQSHAPAPPAPVLELRSAPGEVAVARGYLGDLAVASVQGGAIAVEVERYFSSGFQLRGRIALGSGPVTSLTVAMDYRSDVLVAWQQRGAVYAHVLRASGRRAATQRVGPSRPHPALSALVSDNDHAMVSWASAPGAAVPARTDVWLALSRAGISFDEPRLVDSYTDPAGAGRQSGAVGLVRQADENVMLAWTGLIHGHLAVLASQAVFAGVHPARTISRRGGDCVLEALAAGPANEVLALWRVLPGRALWTTRTWLAGVHVLSDAPQPVTTSAPGPPALAIDPADDSALVAWVAPGSRAVRFALGTPVAGYRPRTFTLPAVERHAAGRGGVHWLRVAVAVLLALLLVAGVALLLGRRRAARPAG